ncbi:MAG: hypothetical protein QF371_05825 [Flavobacteriales bacterium]|jgi:hypothetical protein|nr:hypothetical protein [Flavobacteriales bacterium]
MNYARQHRIIDLIGLLVISIFVVSFITSCEETCYDGEWNQNEEALDCGGPCVPCDTTGGTCFDGIQNQGEEGIDCGGPCNACITDTTITNPNFLCTGTGGNSYFPLSINSYWIYSMPSNQWFQMEIIEETTLNNGNDYFHVVTTGVFGTVHDYFREVAGQVFRWNSTLSAEEVYIPSNPTNGQMWTTSNTDSIVIDDVSATLSSQNGCTYDGLLQVTSYNNGAGSTSYYKQGLGLIELMGVQAYLDSAVVY